MRQSVQLFHLSYISLKVVITSKYRCFCLNLWVSADILFVLLAWSSVITSSSCTMIRSLFGLCLVWVKCFWRAFSWASSRYVGTLHATRLACPLWCVLSYDTCSGGGRVPEVKHEWCAEWQIRWRQTDPPQWDGSVIRFICYRPTCVWMSHLYLFILFWPLDGCFIMNNNFIFFTSIYLPSCLRCFAAQRDESQFHVFCTMTIKTWILFCGLMCWFLLVCAAVLNFVQFQVIKQSEYWPDQIFE